MSTYFTRMLLVYIFHCILFSSGTLYIGTSNCLMSTYFTGMLLSIFFTEYYLCFGTLYVGTYHCFMSTYFTLTYFNFWDMICRRVLLLYVYLFH